MKERLGSLLEREKNSINCWVIREERNKEMLKMTKGSDGRQGKRNHGKKNDQIFSAMC